ncbi:protein CPR [Salix suchowensis]|nr:protein CPR [Salix suchowensis]
MSFAVVVAQVLERKDAAGERMSVDHLSMICTSAVRESLANKSFGSTLSTLRLINETSINRGPRASIHQNLESSTSNRTIKKRVGCTNSACMEDCDSETDLLNNSTEGHTHKLEQVEENISVGCSGQELVLHGQTNQLACAPSSYPLINMYNNMEKSVVEQARSNDLKALEIGVAMKRLKLDEDLLNLTSESNYLERSKLVMGMSRASFKVDKFKTQLEDTRHAELHRKCIDCLVAGAEEKFCVTGCVSGVQTRVVRQAVFILQFLAADTDVSSSSCEPDGVWDPDHSCSCILACTTVLNFKPTMPITFILLLLGAFCGFTGKLCVDTLGGSGSLWLLYWEASCSLQFLSIACTPTLFRVLHGPSSQSPRGQNPAQYFHIGSGDYFSTLLPYFFTTVLWSFAICWPR